MEVVYSRSSGIDVHKDCVLVNEPGKQREVRKKEFRTYWSDLQKLKLWLYASKGGIGIGTDRFKAVPGITKGLRAHLEHESGSPWKNKRALPVGNDIAMGHMSAHDKFW